MIELFTRPVSSWDVLERVKQLIKEDPMRICMSFELRRKDIDAPPPLGFPRCGTVGCVGGLAGELLRGGAADQTSLAHIGRRLGLDWVTQAGDLFYPNWWASGDGVQTPAYANRVIKHIEQFQREHEACLKAHLCETGRVEVE